MERTIDLVVPMVFPQDPEWQRDYERYHGSGQTMNNVRFRSWGTEELLVRCCMKYMPWIRQIHILLARESQVQPWMKDIQSLLKSSLDGKGEDGMKIRIVFHRDFIPAEHLPCFASPCIEMFLHRIPGLSDCFIYANDDMFPLSPLEPSDFFRPEGPGGTPLPCQIIKDRTYPTSPNTFQKKCMWQKNMIGKPFGKHFTKTYPDTGHIFSAILKSSCEEVWRRHGEEISRYLSPLGRTDHSANNWIYLLYQQFAGLYVAYRPTRHYTDQNTPTANLGAIIRDPQAGIVCLNDNEHIGDWQQRAAIVKREIENKLNKETGNEIQKL